MPGLRRCRARLHPAQVFAFAAFAPWPGGGGSRHPAPVASRTAYAPAPDVTGWPEQSQESARAPGHHGGGAAVAGKVKMAQGTGKWVNGDKGYGVIAVEGGPG